MKAIGKERFTDVNDFISHAQAFLKATKENRMFCVCEYNRNGGVKFSFHSYEKTKYFRNYFLLFKLLGYRESKENGKFTLAFGNMDMIFNTNYCIVRRLYSLGFINKKQCATLAQKTPAKF